MGWNYWYVIYFPRILKTRLFCIKDRMFFALQAMQLLENTFLRMLNMVFSTKRTFTSGLGETLTLGLDIVLIVNNADIKINYLVEDYLSHMASLVFSRLFQVMAFHLFDTKSLPNDLILTYTKYVHGARFVVCCCSRKVYFSPPGLLHSQRITLASVGVWVEWWLKGACTDT